MQKALPQCCYDRWRSMMPCINRKQAMVSVHSPCFVFDKLLILAISRDLQKEKNNRKLNLFKTVLK